MSGFVILLVGIVVGSGATLLYNGMQSGDPGRMGAGLKQLMAASREQADQPQPAAAVEDSEARPVRTSFDFYTVLPEIERVIPEDVPVPVDSSPATPAAEPAQKTSSSGHYMLQVASYNQQSKADQMKARLALGGFEPSIQRVTIQGQGQFYRVQVGPFNTVKGLEKANRQLRDMGLKALWLKVSKRP